MNNDLRALGDALETAIARDIEHGRNTVVALRHVPVVHNDTAQEAPVLTEIQDTTTVTPTVTSIRRKRSRRVVVIAGLATLAIGGAAAATAYRLSDDEVSKGLPGGSAIFEGTDPSCSSSDGVVFDCTLASAPTEEVLADYTGTLETFVDSTLHIAGGCRGITADGLQWTCYAGKRAVEEGIIGPNFLGEFSPSPGRG